MEKDFDAYKNYVCPYCFNTLDKCSCEIFPPYHLMFIDRGIQEHIRIINQKGYKTTGCCESHYKNCCLYISFGKEHNFDLIPDSFKYDKNKRAIMYEYKKKISEEEMNELKKVKLNELLEWCKSLPVLPERKHY